MEELIASAERVKKGVPLIPELDQALFHGSKYMTGRFNRQYQDNNFTWIFPSFSTISLNFLISLIPFAPL